MIDRNRTRTHELESLVVGYYDGRKLRFAGRVRAGADAARPIRDLSENRSRPQINRMPVRRPAQREVRALG